MGNTKSITFEDKSNGIFKINVKDNPDYPIVYIRLCWDIKNSKYCIAKECDVLKMHKKHRKIIVVGMRLPEISKENIYEQAFYLSSSSNSIESLEEFFQTKFIRKKENDVIWLPFSGFGYNVNTLDNQNSSIKLLKNNFGFGCLKPKENCLYGRFGNYGPNLIQISYCLGGNFWDNNIDNIVFEKYKIIKYPMLENIIDTIPSICQDNFSDNVEYSIYLNNYIGSSLSINYSYKLLEDKMLTFKTYSRYYSIPELEFENIKFDFRITNILYQNSIYIFKTRGINSPLPFENLFGGHILWNNYLNGIYQMYKNHKTVFDTIILPILHEKNI
jgi:hypothetical protein